MRHENDIAKQVGGAETAQPTFTSTMTKAVVSFLLFAAPLTALGLTSLSAL